MGQTRSAGWIGGAVVVILAVLGATYLFLYQPRSDAAAATRAQASESQSRNDLLEIQVADLAAKARDMDTYLEQLDALEMQVPLTAELVNLTNMIRTGAEQRGLSVVEVAPGVPTPVTAPTPAATTATDPATTGTTTTDGTASGSAVDQAQQTADDASAAADAQDDPNSGAAAAPGRAGHRRSHRDSGPHPGHRNLRECALVPRLPPDEGRPAVPRRGHRRHAPDGDAGSAGHSGAP